MKVILSFLITICLVGNSIFAQHKRSIDSLENTLQNSPNDTSKVLTYHNLAWEYLASNPQKMKNHTLEGIALAQKLKFDRGEYLLLNRLGDYEARQGNYAKGIEYATQSLRIAERNKDLAGVADAYLLLGIIYGNNLKKYDMALEYHQKALVIFEQKGQISSLAATYNMIASIYGVTNQHIDFAHQYTNKSIAIAKQFDNEDFLGWCLSTKGIIYKYTQVYDSALFYLQSANEHYYKAGDKTNVVINNLLMGEIYLKQGKPAIAEILYLQQIPIINELDSKGLLRDSYQGLSESYAAQDRYKEAYQYHLSFTTLKDSLLNEETNKKVTTIQSEYEKEKQEVKIALLEKEKELVKEERNGYIIIFSIIFLALLFILTLIMRNNRQKKKSNLILQEKNEEIESQNEELTQSKEEIESQKDLVEKQNIQLQTANITKDKLFSIVSHDLRSPIGSLKNLMDLIGNNQVTPDEFMSIFYPKLSSSISGIHDTLDNLLHWSYSQMGGIKISPQNIHIQDIINENFALFAEVAKVKQIRLNQQIPPHTYIFADVNQVKLILRNLINNSLKFTPEGGEINVAAQLEENFVAITVADTGIGMTEEQVKSLFNNQLQVSTRGTRDEKGIGLGLLLCKEMVEKNGGYIEVSSTLFKGSAFVIHLPNNSFHQ
jgi:signal transduction histidine kinase